MLTDGQKLDISKTVAKKIVSSRGLSANKFDFDELVNIGFLGITEDDESKAGRQAYLWMLNFVCYKCGKSIDSRYNNKLIEPDAMPAIANRIDLFHAILTTLNEEEIQLLKDRYNKDISVIQMAKARGITQPSISDRISRILTKLRIALTPK
jgi:DNA-directed RNA polymerase specialized sigma subunit